MSKISSNSLFHFTSKEFLIKILHTGFKISYSGEYLPNQYSDGSSGEHIEVKYFDNGLNRTEEKVFIPMICFCDIPLNLNNLHKKEYGNYGIGLKKNWGILNGINPLFYIAKNSSVAKELTKPLQKTKSTNFRTLHFNTINGLIKTEEIFDYDPNNIEIIDNWGNLYDIIQLNTKFVSEISRSIPHSFYYDKIKYFYDEREWRFLPKHPYVIRKRLRKHSANNDEYKQFYQDPLLDKKPNYDNLLFNFDDIDYIIIENEIDKDEIINCLFESKLFNNKKIKMAEIIEKFKFN